MSDFTQEQLGKLKAAYASGVRQVTDSQGNSVTYSSMADMERAIARIERALASPAAQRHSNPIFEKGL